MLNSLRQYSSRIIVFRKYFAFLIYLGTPAFLDYAKTQLKLTINTSTYVPFHKILSLVFHSIYTHCRDEVPR